MPKILVLTKRQYTHKDLLDDRFGRLREIPLELARRGHRVTGLCLSYRSREEDWVSDGPVRWKSINAGLSKVYVRDQWIEPAIEVGIGPTSDVALCREEPRPTPNTCHDGYALGGLRFRPLRESDRVLRPFVHLLLGAYWKGTGLEDPDLLPGTFAIQTGGGIDIRSPASIHGIRVSGDYRHVFDGERGRHQLQFVIAYFLGWRGP